MSHDQAGGSEALYKETLERLWGEYEGGAQALRTLLTGLLLFVIAFLAFLAYPYVAIQGSLAALERRVDQAKRDKESLNVQLAKLQQVDASVDALAESGRAKLREQVGAWYAERVSDEIMTAKARAAMLALWKDMQKQVEELVRPAAVDWKRADANVLKYLDEHPEFWQSYAQKGETVDQLDRAINGVIGPLRESCAARAGEIETKITSMNAEVEDRRKARDEQAKRFKDINSPLGNLPIGLGESILVFPLIVAFGFVASAFRLQRLVRLSSEIETVYRVRDQAGKIITDDRLELMAPMSGVEWLRLRGGRLRLAVMILPALIFSAGVGIVLYSWSLSRELLAVPGSGIVYSMLYIAALGAMIFAGMKTNAQLVIFGRSFDGRQPQGSGTTSAAI
jgi:hypothetical protein